MDNVTQANAQNSVIDHNFLGIDSLFVNAAAKDFLWVLAVRLSVLVWRCLVFRITALLQIYEHCSRAPADRFLLHQSSNL